MDQLSCRLAHRAEFTARCRGRAAWQCSRGSPGHACKPPWQQHLATLGSLEAPLTRLLKTASDVPQAAAEVITQLREEMTRT
jgi:hypothetical protein